MKVEQSVSFSVNISYFFYHNTLTLNPLTWKIWWAPNNASRWQMGFNFAYNLL